VALVRGGVEGGGSVSWLKRWGPRPMARLDPAVGDPGLAELRKAAKAKDWAGMRGRLEAVPDGWDRTWLLVHAVKVAGIEGWIPEAIAAEPESALAVLVSGARQIEWAWEARTGARAQHVSRERFEAFHERLRVAEALLYDVAEREPEWVAPWYFLQVAGRGLQVGPEIARLRFEASVRRCPGHPGAHRQQLQQVCHKWGGSHEQMHAFARESMLSAPEGSALGELVAIAHLEQWLDQDEDGAGHSYMYQDDVAEQLREAAERSIWHPDFGRPRGWIETYNTFAMAFSLAGEKKAAAELFPAIGGIVTPFPWQYINGADPTVPFRALRSDAGR
jgi:hypothetical protein